MAKEEKQNIMNRFLQGWQQLFGGSMEKAPTLKPFPKNHFYSPEELEYLSHSDKVSTIEQWAIATGKWAFEQGKNKTEIPFAPVKWQDGLMATWIDGRLTPDPISRQAEKLSLLEEHGFDVPERYENIIKDYEASRLLGKYFQASLPNGNGIVKVDSYEKGHLIEEPASLVLQKWEEGNLSSKKEKVPYEDFKNGIGEKYTILSEQQRNDFTQKLSNWERGKTQYNHVLDLIGQSYPPIFGGHFPLEQQKLHDVTEADGKVIPVSWSVTNGNIISVGVHTDKGNNQQHIVIDENSAYKATSLLETVAHILKEEQTTRRIHALTSILGNDFGDSKIFAKANNEPLVNAKDGTVNAVIATNNDRIIAFNLNEHKEISLSDSEKRELMSIMTIEGYTEQGKLRNKASVPLMKDYIESMSDKDNILSGDYEELPYRSTVSRLYGEYERYSEEYNSYNHSSFPLAAEDREELIADLQSSFLSFKQELTKMVDAYSNQSQTVNENDAKRLEQLDRLLERRPKDNIHYQKATSVEMPSQQEMALRDAIIDKMRSNGMDVITDVEAGQIAHEESSQSIKDMGSRTQKKMGIIGNELQGRDFSNAQQAVVQVYSGKGDNISFLANRSNETINIMMRQGNEVHAGAKHSLFGHFGTSKGYITSSDILLIPEIIERGTRKISENGRIEYKYNNPEDNTIYKVITEKKKGHEVFSDFYTNRKANPSVTSSLANSSKTNTPESAHNNDENALSDAKVQRNVETTKGNEEKVQNFHSSSGEIYGFTKDGKIYIDPRIANAETPIHEYTHLWAAALQENNPKEWDNIVGLMKDTPVWGEVKRTYPELTNDNELADEVLATYSGRRGAERLRKEMGNLSNGNNPESDKIAALSAIDRIQTAIAKFWKAVADFLHIHYTSAEEVADKSLSDLLAGVDPRKHVREDSTRKEQRNIDYHNHQVANYVEPPILGTKTEGRWHSPAHLEKDAYHTYGILLTESMDASQEHVDHAIPRDLEGNPYIGISSLMLKIESSQKGYEVPIFLDTDTLTAQKIRIKENGVGFPVIKDDGIKTVYNITQTDYPLKHPQAYNDLKLEMVSEERYRQDNKAAILSLADSPRFSAKVSFDSHGGAATYNAAENAIHMTPVEQHENMDDFLKDFAEGLIKSTRKEQSNSTSFEAVIKESLIAHIGSCMIGEKYDFKTNLSDQNQYWKERLRNDPDYAKSVLRAAETSSNKIISYVEQLQKNAGKSQDLDLRSSTPVDMDVDGNGIVESQENLAADRKQGASEEHEEKEDDSHRHERRFHYGK